MPSYYQYDDGKWYTATGRGPVNSIVLAPYDVAPGGTLYPSDATLLPPGYGRSTTTTQEPPMTGTKPIVLPVAASAVTEYASRAEAQAEAERLCAKSDAPYVVYVPVLRVRPKKDLVVEEIPNPGA